MRQATWLTLLTVLPMTVAGVRLVHAAPGPLVEEIAEPRPDFGPMDYLAVGQVVTLKPGQRLVLDYLGKCLRETIVGGTVAVGVDSSQVTGGTVKRETVDCTARASNLGERHQAGGTGLFVVRAPNRAKSQTAP